MNLSDKTVLTLAGNPMIPGFADGTGAAARFSGITGITLCKGFLYITERYNRTIRRLNLATKEVSTIAGKAGAIGSRDGIGDQARFNQPFGITNDEKYLYVTDAFNCTIRRINLADRKVTTIAGSPKSAGTADGIGTASRFSVIVGAIIYADGKLYISDSDNQTIRKLDLSTNTVSTVAGKAGDKSAADGGAGTSRLEGPKAFYVSGDYLYFIDSPYALCAIRRFHIPTNIVETIAGTTAGNYKDEYELDGTGKGARILWASGLAEYQGKLIFPSLFSTRFRQCDMSTMEVTSFVGNPPKGAVDGIGTRAGFSVLHSLVVLGDYAYVTEENDLRKINLKTAEVTTVAKLPDFTRYIETDGTNIYTSDNWIRRFDPATGAMETITAEQTYGSMVYLHPYLYVMDGRDNVLYRIDPATHAKVGIAGKQRVAGYKDGIGWDARFNRSSDLTSDGKYLYVIGDNYNSGGGIRKVDPATGEVTTIPKTPALGDRGCFYNGGFYLLDSQKQRIAYFSMKTSEVVPIAGVSGKTGFADGKGAEALFDWPQDIEFYGNTIIITDYGNTCIRIVR